MQGKCELCCVGSDASSPPSVMLGRDVHFEVAASVEFGGRRREKKHDRRGSEGTRNLLQIRTKPVSRVVWHE